MNPRIEKAIFEMQCEVRANFHLYHSVNNGGCGIFAKLLSERLKREGVACKVVYKDSQTPNKKPLIKKTKTAERVTLKERIAIAANHVLVQVEDILIDATDTYIGIEPDGVYTKKELEYVLANGHWGASYDRRKNKTVEKIIRQSFLKTAE